jgi:hypothetical protein
MTTAGTILYDPSQTTSEARNAAIGAFGCAFSELGATGNVFFKRPEGEAVSNALPEAGLNRYLRALHHLGEIDAPETVTGQESVEVEADDSGHMYQACIPHVLCHGHQYFGLPYGSRSRGEAPWIFASGRSHAQPTIITLAYDLSEPASVIRPKQPSRLYEGVGVGPKRIASNTTIPSTAAQQRERRETAALVTSIQSLLPGFSEEDLGRLIGVTRVAWRDWQKGLRAARSRNRRQLLKLRQILQLKQRTSPETFLTHWLDTPVGGELRTTPAELLAGGRVDLVAILAARSPAPEGDGIALRAPLDLGGLADAERTAEALENQRLYSQESESDDEAL